MTAWVTYLSYLVFLLESGSSYPFIDSRNQNYIAHRSCSRSCPFSETCLHRHNMVTCLSSCPRSCSTKNHPVCGSDGETYLNKCLLRMRNCHTTHEITIVSKGECPPNPGLQLLPSLCQIDCSSYRPRPVCGTNKHTYPNICQLNRGACQQDFSFSFSHYGSCVQDACSRVRCPWGQVCTATSHRGPTCVCNSECPVKQKVVCAEDGKTYYNQCHLDAENCLTGTYIRKASDGICANTYNKERKMRIHRASVAFSPESE